jgi:hypothetical protein
LPDGFFVRVRLINGILLAGNLCCPEFREFRENFERDLFRIEDRIPGIEGWGDKGIPVFEQFRVQGQILTGRAARSADKANRAKPSRSLSMRFRTWFRPMLPTTNFSPILNVSFIRSFD